MSRQVKNAKDIVTGELVYFVSHAKATYLGDGSTVEDTVNVMKRDIKNITLSTEATPMVSVTYEELKNLRDNGKLVAGMQYRITDYVTTTTQENTRSAGHQFDIIVTADDEKTLNEVARACRSEFDIEKYKDAYSGTWGEKMIYLGTQEYEGKEYHLYESESNNFQMLVDFNNILERYPSISDVYTFRYYPNYTRELDDYSGWGVWECGKDSNESIDFKHSEPNYFDSCKLDAWQIWYSLDNDAERFAWAIKYDAIRVHDVAGDAFVLYRRYKEADNGNKLAWAYIGEDTTFNSITEWDNIDVNDIVYTEKNVKVGNKVQVGSDEMEIESMLEGKGVIYRMIDEWNNDCPYDFKNIKFYNDERETDVYTFTWIDDSYNVMDTTVFGNNGTLTFDGDVIGVYSNVIKPYIKIGSGTKQSLNNITFISDYEWVGSGNDGFYGYYSNSFGNSCYNNILGNGCSNNTFGENCHHNSFGAQLTNNSFGVNCSHNSFGNGCGNNTFSNNCQTSSFGNNCNHNSFGENCYYNIFGNGYNYNSFSNYCNHNSFGNDCNYNSFSNYCNRNSFGNRCSNNSFGSSCHSNNFGNDCNKNSFGNYCMSNTFLTSCEANSFDNSCSTNNFSDYCRFNKFSNNCYGNKFGDHCTSNSFGTGCYYNSFSDDCYHNSFGNDCWRNSFDIDCRSNSFGNNCEKNSFDNNCHYNSFGSGCDNNSFGNGCSRNSLSNNCNDNIFGSICYDNSFGNECVYNRLSDGCNYNSFGNKCIYNSFRLEASTSGASLKYCYYNHFDDGCSYNVIWSSEQPRFPDIIKNINVNRGVCGTDSNYNYINIDTINSEKEINVINYNGHIYVDYGDIFKVTYSELVDLRDNSQLIPGRQYRITDYVTTTGQKNTTSAEHKFDIIVTAINECTLSEDAQAIQNYDEGYFDECDLNSWELKYCLDNDIDRFAWVSREIIENKKIPTNVVYDSSSCSINSNLVNGNEFITPFLPEYYVYIDPIEGGELYDTRQDKSLFYEFGYEVEPNGITENLCIYKSDEAIYQDEGVDYADKFFYRGIKEIDGEEYDYWQKCETSESGTIEFGIFDSNKDSIRDYQYMLTNRIVTGNVEINEYKPLNYIDIDYTIIVDESSSSGDGELNPDYSANFKLVSYGYELDNNGQRTLVAYRTDASTPEDPEDVNNYRFMPDYEIPCFYVGTENVDGDTYDKWRVISDWDWDNEDNQKYYLTKQIVENGTIKESAFINYDVPSFTFGKPNGTGIIYYMKDEWGNECPYDFKNIKFYNDDRGTYVYTFTWIDDSYNVMDTTVFGNNGTLTLYGEIFGVYGNVIKPYMEMIWDEDSGDFIATKQSLNNITFISDYEYEREGNDGFYGCYNNSFGNNCHHNSFGNGCYNNSFGNGCYNNSFGNGCSTNSFGNDCINNSFGDYCNTNVFGNHLRNNSFGNDCHHNSFGNDCSEHSFGDGCTYNSFGNSCVSHNFGSSCYNNNFGNNCYYNSLGNNCYHNSFGNNCSANSFRLSASTRATLLDHCRYNHFDDNCSYNVIWNNVQPTSSNKLQNINIVIGVHGEPGKYNYINIVEKNAAYEIKVAKNSKGDIKVYCEADLIE